MCISQSGFGISGCFAQQVQTSNPVYVNDSPEAAELFGRLKDHYRSGHLTEASRVGQELLDRFPTRLLRLSSEEDGLSDAGQIQSDRYGSVRSQVHAYLMAHADLLDVYRAAQEAVAAEQLRAGQPVAVLRSRALTAPGLEAGLLLARDFILNARFRAAIHTLDELRAHPDLSVDAPSNGNDASRRHARTWCLLMTLAGQYGGDDKAQAVAASQWERWQLDGSISGALSVLNDTPDSQHRPLPLAAQASGRSATSGAYGHDQRGGDPSIHSPALAQMSRRPVWRARIDTSLSTALTSHRISEAQRRNLKIGSEGGQYLGVFPVVRDDVIVVNDGLSVSEFDRYDGTRLWQYSPNVSNLTVSTLSSVHTGPWDSVTVSPRTVTLHGDTALCILWNGDGNLAQAQSSRLVCLDLLTGQPLWSLLPARIDPGFEFACFIGCPVTAEGLLFTVVRTLGQQLGSDYLLAIDPATGTLVWEQYLVSSAVGRGWSWLPATNPVWDAGSVYVTSPLGVVGSFEAATGEPEWICSMPTAPDRFRFEESRPWAFDLPLLTDAGLVTFTPDRQRVAVLDRFTGAVHGDVATTTLGEPAYMLSDGQWIYAIGSVVTGFPAERLTDPRDTLLSARRISAMPTPVGRAMVVGRGQELIVPTLDGLFIVDASLGRIIESADPIEWGNPLVIGAEVIICTTAGIDSYMPFEVGQPILQAKSEARPSDPMPAISLAALAFQHHKWDLISPAVDLATERINADPFNPAHRIARARLMNRLLEMVRGLDVSTAVGESTASDLFYRLDLLAAAPDERVAYLMSHGSFLEETGHPREAIEALQQITTSPELSKSYWAADAGSVQARIEAGRRIRQILQAHGPQTYAVFNQQASEAFVRVMQRGGTGTDELLALADRYPAAQILSQLYLETGRRLARQGLSSMAIALWRLGLESDIDDDETRPQLLGELLSLQRATGRYRSALFELEMQLRSDPLALVKDPITGSMTSLESWRASLEAGLSTSTPTAAVGDFVPSRPALEVQCDELLLPVYGDPLTGTALIRQGRTLHAVGGHDFQPVWSRALSRQDVHLLSVQPRSHTALLWYWESHQHVALERISTDTGQRLWLQDQLGDARAAWNDAASPAGTMDRPLSSRYQSNRKTGQPELSPALGDGCVFIATESGHMLCIEMDTGAPRWEQQYDASLVTQVAADAGILALALVRQTPGAQTLPVDRDDDEPIEENGEPGFQRPNMDLPADGGFDEAPEPQSELIALTAHMLLVDPRNGDVIADLKLPDSQLVQWCNIGPAGELVYASESAIYCYDTYRHEQRWRIDDPALAGTRWPMSDAGMLLLTDMDDTIVSLDYQTGRQARVGDIVMEERQDTFPKLLAYRDQHLLKTSRGVYMLHADGTITGRLTRSESDGLYIMGVMPTSDRITILQRHNMVTSTGVIDRHASLYHVDKTGRRVSIEIEPEGTALFPRSDAVQAINGWIVVDAGQRVLAFPCPVTNSTGQ